MVAIAVLTSKVAKDMPWKDLADIIKAILPLDRLDSVYPTTQGVELGFVDKDSLLKFVAKADRSLGVTSDDVVSVVCVRPASGSGHCTVDDGTIVSVLKKYGVIKGAQHEFYPDTRVKNGVRKFQMEITSEPPAMVSFGGTTFRITFTGQTPRCFRCGDENHLVSACPNKSMKCCHNCGSSQHLLKDCREPKKCTVCGGDHSYRKCEKSFAGKVRIPGGKWGDVEFDEEISDEDLNRAADEAEEFSKRKQNSAELVPSSQQSQPSVSLSPLPLGTLEASGRQRSNSMGDMSNSSSCSPVKDRPSRSKNRSAIGDNRSRKIVSPEKDTGRRRECVAGSGAAGQGRVPGLNKAKPGAPPMQGYYLKNKPKQGNGTGRKK